MLLRFVENIALIISALMHLYVHTRIYDYFFKKYCHKYMNCMKKFEGPYKGPLALETIGIPTVHNGP